MIYETIADLMREDAALVALVGDRIYWQEAEAAQAYPDVIQYVAGGGVGTENLDAHGAPFTIRISIECRGSTYAGPTGAHAVGEEVRRILDNRVGTFGAENIQLMRQVSDMPLMDDTSSVQRRVIDFRVIYSPA